MAEIAKPRRRWLQFSLRGLLVVFAAVSVCLGLRVKAVRDVDHAVATLRGAGLTVEPHWYFTPPTMQQMIAPGFTWQPKPYSPPPFWKRVLHGDGDREWSISVIPHKYQSPMSQRFKAHVIEEAQMLDLIDELGAIGTISSLDLEGTSVGNEFLRRIRSLRQLKSLDLNGTGIDDDGLVLLESMTWIESLHLGDFPFGRRDMTTPEGVDRLKKALAKTRVVHMGGWRGAPSVSGFSMPMFPFKPDDADSYVKRGNARSENGWIEEAIDDFETAIRIDPKNADAHASLAWRLATSSEARFRNGKRAVKLATKACELSGWREALFLDTLAAACAESGDFANAVKWAEKAMALAPDEPDFKRHRALFKADIKLRAPDPMPDLTREV